LAPHGFKDATDNAEAISRWWREEPTANIGIATGSASGIFAVDVDIKSGGHSSWHVLVADRPIQTAAVKTPSGGLHFYFNVPSATAIRCSVGRLAVGVDVRGDGGYIVAPCSQTEVGSYTWVDETAIADPPDWLVELLTASGPDRQSAPDSAAIPKGRRNHTLARVAGRLRHAGISVEAIEAALLVENRCRCDPPLGDSEVSAIARSIGRYSAGSGVAEEPKVLRFRTAADLAREATPLPEFVIHGYAALGCVTELTGAPKRSGKTTLLAFAARALLDGQTFLGQPTRRSAVVWLTEEGSATFVEPLRAAGILGREDFHYLSWFELGDTSLADVMRQAAAKCHEVGAKLLIVDTLPQFAGLRGDTENNAGDALLAVAPLRAAAQTGLAVIATRHDRKSGGDVGESGRGSSAFTAAFDIVVALRRCEGAVKTRRLLQALSRFRQTDESHVVDLTESGYVSLGSQTAVALEEAKIALLDKLPGPPGLTMDEMLTAVPGVGRTAIQDALRELGAAVGRTGRGKKGDPYRYFRQSDDSAAPTIPSSGRKNPGVDQ
jgi:hypothetical protein